jgi:HlyD family secretion protein
VTWRRAAWIVSLALLALAIAAYLLWPRLFGVIVTPIMLRQDMIVQTLVASGRVETRSRVEIGSEIQGTIAEVQGEEGTVMHRGEALARIVDTDQRNAVEQAEIGVRNAEAHLRHQTDVSLPAAERALDQSIATRDAARLQYARTARLLARGIATQAARDEARKLLDIAEAAVLSAQLQVESNGPNGSDGQMAKLALDTARAALVNARTGLRRTVIAAPSNGRVVNRSVEVGSLVQPGRTLFVFAPQGSLRLVAEIDERNLGLLRIGQPALASAEAYPDQRFAAKLSVINPSINAARGSVTVKLAVESPPPNLLEDMTVSIEIEVARRDKAQLLPASAVRDIATGNPFVLVIEDGRAARRPVKLGARGLESIEILGGLAEAEQVIDSADSSVVEGRRVRLRPSDVALTQDGR